MLLPYSSNEENRQNEATISTYYYLYLYIKMKEYLYYRFVFAQGNYQSLDTMHVYRHLHFDIHDIFRK